jgi:hypothetical protein
MSVRTCVTPAGHFVWGVHKPAYTVDNLRTRDYPATLGLLDDGTPIENSVNFPPAEVKETEADWVYEIPNAFPFRGATYISRSHADRCAGDPKSFRIATPPQVSLEQVLKERLPSQLTSKGELTGFFKALPEPVQICLAATSTDPNELKRLSHLSCDMIMAGDPPQPQALRYSRDDIGNTRPRIHNHSLYEVLANNPHLPDDYKLVMVLRPGIQGASEVVGDQGGAGERSHVFEYLRRNSYIPWGHYAANVAHDAVRYHMRDLSLADMRAVRHLYYQRTYVRLAGALGLISGDIGRRSLSEAEIEILRKDVTNHMNRNRKQPKMNFTSTLWGWNFGFDYAPSHYRLHASHQQIHQQYALVPDQVPIDAAAMLGEGQVLPSFAYGDLVADFINRYRQDTGVDFFDCHLAAIKSNVRIDGDTSKPASLIVYEDPHVLLFVPKAQTSQWELQLMPKAAVGNLLETDQETRAALDRAMWIALSILEAMGTRMITNIEISKRLDAAENGQRLLYSFLPKMPRALGAFSEAQMRWIIRHYPEDFAAACRCKMAELALTDRS